jgi:UDP:flavonoid glycosyltransferase YjiC (YdhE family)
VRVTGLGIAMKLKIENIQAEIIRLEEQIYSKNRLNRIRDDFESYSKENKISRKKLLEYLGMSDLENKKLGNRIFQCMKSTFSH